MAKSLGNISYNEIVKNKDNSVIKEHNRNIAGMLKLCCDYI